MAGVTPGASVQPAFCVGCAGVSGVLLWRIPCGKEKGDHGATSLAEKRYPQAEYSAGNACGLLFGTWAPGVSHLSGVYSEVKAGGY